MKESYLGSIEREKVSQVIETEFLEKYLKRVKARKSRHTLKNCRTSIRQFSEFLIESNLTFEEATAETVNEWIDEFLLDDYAPRSIRVKVYDISSFYQYLENRGVVNGNPVEDVELKNFTATKIEEHSDRRYLTIEEYESMLEECELLRNKLALQLLWETGCRVGEAVDIRIKDIDRDERSIEIETEKKGHLSNTKSRDVYYGRVFAITLEEWLEDGERKKYMGAEEGEEGYLLVTRESPQMSTDRLSDIVREVAERAGLQRVMYTDASGTDRNRVTPHIFRYSYAVHRVKKGMPLVYLQDLMGHEDMEITREYLKYRDDDIKEAARKYRPTP